MSSLLSVGSLNPKDWTTWPKYSNIKKVGVLVSFSDTALMEDAMSIGNFNTHKKALKTLFGDRLVITPEMGCDRPGYVIELASTATQEDKNKYRSYFTKSGPNHICFPNSEQIRQMLDSLG